MDSHTLPKLQFKQKPTYIKVAEDIDFYTLFITIEDAFENCFLFESLSHNDDDFSRYSIIGFDPPHIIRARGTTLIFDETPHETTNPYFALRDIMPDKTIARHFSGGLVGYLGYDSVNYFEESVRVKAHPNFDSFAFGTYMDGLVLDKTTNEVFYFYHDNNRKSLVDEFLKKPVRQEISFTATYLGDNTSRKQHAKMVATTKEAISAGKIFQCEVGFKSEYKITGEAIGIYDKLRRINPSPFMYYVKFGKQKIIGASPELLFSLKDNKMTTRPLAGSVRRGSTDQEDQQLARQLLNDPKEIAEHKMLVDLHRNDIGRVARIGSTHISYLMDIKKFSHVQHIESEITGMISPNHDMFSALAANFPAGTLSGAPKIEAIKIIDTNETEARGPYGGGVGYLGFNGDVMFAIAIRSLFINGRQAYAQTSGGNVYDSQPDQEYDEIQRKLAAMKKVLTL